ncbi:MAG: 3-deoxy-manno-octulosonate cytidylyltransferase [Holosporales bacterium]|jgi:3-deoxy-manno-octulosonate cytidylyltransferase (CMP-KDO synthetase)|nr:3-deoxy-manno-octulosonate cytidylyltransferase [Holosporales bacterium]
MNDSAVILIPARLNSSRFPQKILAPIDGKSMILHVLHRAQGLNFCEVYVACCCESVKKIIEDGGGKAILTDPDLPSGTDRIYAAMLELPTKPEFVINLQGDTPVFSESIIPAIFEVLQNDASIEITTPVTMCDNNKENAENPNIVKVVFNGMEEGKPGKAIYFSRNCIPSGITQSFYSHIGIYAYRRRALEKFVSIKPSYLETTERLEQLRAIQNGMNIWAVPVQGEAIAVDIITDLEAVERYNRIA